MTESEKLAFLENSIEKLFNQKLALSLDDDLNDLGLDSLDIIELQLHYEESTDHTIPDNVPPVKTVQDLINLM
jgi:acyl carrier protein